MPHIKDCEQIPVIDEQLAWANDNEPEPCHARSFLSHCLYWLPMITAGAGVVMALDTSAGVHGLALLIAAVLLYWPCMVLSERLSNETRGEAR